MPILSRYVKNFNFQRDTFKFPNHFAHSVIFWRPVPFLPVPIGDAKFGLCGGMSYAVKLYFRHQVRVPLDSKPPSASHYPELLEYLKRCQVATLTWKALWNYTRLLFTSQSTDEALVRQSWLEIKRDIDNNELVLTGLIRTKLPWEITKHHQVLVYGYCENTDTGNVELCVYDPKSPTVEAKISFNSKGAVQAVPASLSPIYTLFPVNCDYDEKPPVINQSAINLNSAYHATKSTFQQKASKLHYKAEIGIFKQAKAKFKEINDTCTVSNNTLAPYSGS